MRGLHRGYSRGCAGCAGRSEWSVAILTCPPFCDNAVLTVYQPARVTAHTVPTDQYPQRTVILIKLDPKVMDREEALGK